MNLRFEILQVEKINSLIQFSCFHLLDIKPIIQPLINMQLNLVK